MERQAAPVRILLDGCGGDDAPEVVLQAASIARKRWPELVLGLVGTPDLQARAEAMGLAFVAAEEAIAMDDAVALAVRRKRRSTMHLGCRAVKEGQWDAFVSAGNTGALMAVAKLVLRTIPGVDRPAIATMIPARKGTKTLFLDMGANVDCTAEHLVQFALMGACYMQAAEGVDNPRVGLLNIGTEAIKGNDVVKLAASMLEKAPVNFVGNVEGGDLFSSEVDVVVADGFVGNVALKTMEGTARFLSRLMKEAFLSSWRARIGAWLAKPALDGFRDKADPSRYNGAPLLGLSGIVVKSHGGASAEAYANAIGVAAREVEAGIVVKIGEMLADWGVS